ncbi:MAG: hypothetical protein V3U78_05175 [Thiotrichaceae bacterium]
MTATQTNFATPSQNNIPQVHNLVIDGIDQQNVNETRLGYVNATVSAVTRPASTKCLASIVQKTERQPIETKQVKKPEVAFRLMETTDTSLGLIMAAKAIKAGMKSGETIVLVSNTKTDQMMRKLEMIGLDIEQDISNRKLIITQFSFDEELGLSTNYRQAFGELFKQANTVVDRIIILDMDSLVNLESQYLAFATVSKFTQAADEMGCKVIAQYARNQSEEHDRLDAACSSLVNAYFVMQRGEQGGKYLLQGKNRPV